MARAPDPGVAACRRGPGAGPALRTLIVGFGRSGRGLHLPVLQRAREQQATRHLFAPEPVVVFDPHARGELPPGTRRAGSLTQAAGLADRERTVVHLCTPPPVRVEQLVLLARLGFRKILVEKPLAVDRRHLVEIDRIRRDGNLELGVVGPWRTSTLTRRLEQVLRRGQMGPVSSISVVQRKPRFTRSLAADSHRSAFDVEIPHAVGLVLALVGDARVRDAASTDMSVDGVVVPRMGTAWLALEHEDEIRSELFSDLTAPTRERRITLEFEGGTVVGHYACSEDDGTSQLSVMSQGSVDRTVFQDDALTAFMVEAYERFALGLPQRSDPALDAQVVSVVDEAKRRCGDGDAPAETMPDTVAQAGSPVGGGREHRPVRTAVPDGGDATVRPAEPGADDPAAPGRPEDPGVAIPLAGIGDEAGADLADQLAALERLGWSRIELRTVGEVAIADLDDDAFLRLVDTVRRRGLQVVGVASRIGSWARPIDGDFGCDLDELAVLERRCRVLGTRYVRVMSYPNAGLDESEWGRRAVERMRRLAARAEHSGLVLLHENCSGWAGRDGERMQALLEAVDSPALQLLFDTGNGLAHGYDGYELLTRIVDRVAHVHVKDGEATASDAAFTVPGAGQARVAECLRLLLARGYTGALSIEPHVAFQPHARPEPADGGSTAERHDGFVASGKALEHLLSDEVVPHLPGWRIAKGGLLEAPTP